MKRLEGLRGLRVLPPFASTPVADTGCRPPDVRPSPPPCGWSTGFMETPRLCGFLPSHRLRPALPCFTFLCSALPTCPMGALHRTCTFRISLEGSSICEYSPSLSTSWAKASAVKPVAKDRDYSQIKLPSGEI